MLDGFGRDRITTGWLKAALRGFGQHAPGHSNPSPPAPAASRSLPGKPSPSTSRRAPGEWLRLVIAGR